MDARPLKTRLRRPTRLERRLRGWLLGLALGPVLLVIAVGTWLWLGSLGWAGTLGPWTRVADSGRELVEAVERAGPQDPALTEALERHRRELSASLVLARRWEFLGRRLAAVLPALALGFAALLAVLALAVSRRLARDLARPIHELVDWAGRLAREEPLPPFSPAEASEVREVQTLRGALRAASADLAEARRRALEAERVRTWGEMARRVAHEMKNPLTPLRLAAHRLARLEGDGVGESLRVIEEETGRLEELAGRFAALGRPPAGPTSEVDLKELLESLLAHDAPPSVERSLSAEPGLPHVEAHYEELVRAFRNLIRNAVDAMEGEGTMRVEIRSVEQEPSPSPSPSCVEIRIADSGPGVAEEARERVFEPDYTTKARGTGLGLALVRQTAAAHGGAVWVESGEGGGAVFVVRLPVAAERVEA